MPSRCGNQTRKTNEMTTNTVGKMTADGFVAVRIEQRGEVFAARVTIDNCDAHYVVRKNLVDITEWLRQRNYA